MNQNEFIKNYNDEYREKFNEDLFHRDDFKEIFAAIWKNLDSTQKNWRVMFKV